MVKKRKHTRRRQRGGAVDCYAIGFDTFIMQASLGRNYPKLERSLGTLHQEGQKMDFDTLVYYGKYGIMEWYSRQAGSEKMWDTLTNIPDVKILIAFFNRMKIVLENISILTDLLGSTFVELMFPPSAHTYLRRKYNTNDKFIDFIGKSKFKDIYIDLKKIYDEKDKYNMYEYALSYRINQVQCIMWYVMKFQKLPIDFKMDDHIKHLAETKINIDKLDKDETNIYSRHKLILEWAKFSENTFDLLKDSFVESNENVRAGASTRKSRRLP
jgi:hypothetical protein